MLDRERFAHGLCRLTAVDIYILYIWTNERDKAHRWCGRSSFMKIMAPRPSGNIVHPHKLTCVDLGLFLLSFHSLLSVHGIRMLFISCMLIPRMMRLHRLLSITTFINLVAAQGKCRFGNGTLLPDVPEWNIYQPCPGADGPTTICCAIGRTNPPWGNISLGFTQDECLPNGLCQNRLTTSEGERLTTWVLPQISIDEY